VKFDYYASDLHFRHLRICEFGRPFQGVDHHDDEIITRWNSRVTPYDKVLILGDLAFNVGLPLVERLNGHKWLIMGNHEHKNIKEYVPLFEDIKACYEDKKNGIIFTHIPVHESQLDRWPCNVHGHTHAFNIPDKRYVNICMEQTDYAPISHDELMARTTTPTKEE